MNDILNQEDKKWLKEQQTESDRLMNGKQRINESVDEK